MFDKSSHIWLHLDYRLNRVVLKHLSRLMGGREEIAIAPLNWNSVLPTIKHLTLKGNNSIHSLSLNAFCSCFKCSCFCCDVNYFHHTIWKLARIYWSARNFPLWITGAQRMNRKLYHYRAPQQDFSYLFFRNVFEPWFVLYGKQAGCRAFIILPLFIARCNVDLYLFL